MSNPAQGAVGAETMTAAEQVCHEEQMVIWSSEMAERLAMGDWLREHLSYEDKLGFYADLSEGIRDIVGSAFALASPRADSDERTAGAIPRAALVEIVAQHFHDEEHQHEGYNWTWPEYADDDGRRGNSGYVSITPPVVQMECREAAERLVRLFERYTPAQPAGAVPDSLRALSEAASEDWDTNEATPYILGPPIDGEIDRFEVIARGPHGYAKNGDDIRKWQANRMFAVAAVKHVRTLLASHPAGQSATAEPDPTLTYWIESETERLCNLYPDAAASIVEFREELVGLMEGNLAGQSAGSGAWSEHSPQEIVRRTRCEADHSWGQIQQHIWRQCCDKILERLGKPAPDSTRTGQGEAEERLIGPKMTPEQEARIAHNLCGEFAPDAVIANASFVKAFYAELYAAARPAAPEAQGAERKPGAGDPWVKVEDQLPGEQGQDSEEVIVFLNGHCDRLDDECRKGGAWGHRFGWFDAERQCFRVHGRPDASVTHWMPKPAPPASSGQGGR